MDADLCSTLRGGRTKILDILYSKPCIFGNICAIIGAQNEPILLCWILILNQLFTKQLRHITVGTYWHNRKAIYAKLAFIITENIHKLLLLWQNIGGDITYRVPQTNYWGHVPRFRRLWIYIGTVVTLVYSPCQRLYTLTVQTLRLQCLCLWAKQTLWILSEHCNIAILIFNVM